MKENGVKRAWQKQEEKSSGPLREVDISLQIILYKRGSRHDYDMFHHSPSESANMSSAFGLCLFRMRPPVSVFDS